MEKKNKLNYLLSYKKYKSIEVLKYNIKFDNIRK